jgi:DNA helicase-2/ATP-dependent DNA helicase PcrA
LQELERKLGYCAYLEGRGTRSEAGVDEAENVKQFIEEAKGRGTLLEYLVYLKQLAAQQAAQQAAAGGNLLTIRTIHSAKGLEWPVVIIPSCDDGNIPHRKSDNLEEERRLLYVALTRTRRDLYIYHLAGQPSPFLRQAQWQIVLRAVEEIRGALAKPPATWSDAELRAVAIAAPQLGLLDYFHDWHKWRPGEEAAVADAVVTFLEEAAASRVGRGDKAGMAEMAQQWRAATQGITPTPAPVALDPGVVREVAQPQIVRRSSPAPTPSAPTPGRTAHAWETFDEVEHPAYGRGIVISTTTTTRGRELKVQFVDGSLRHFRDDDPALVQG